MRIGVVSLNVCWGLSSTLPPAKERAAAFGSALEASDARILNFQEVWTPGLLRVLRRRLPSFPHVAFRRGAAGWPAGGLVSFSRIPIRSVSYASFRGARPRAGGLLFRSAAAIASSLQGVLTFELTGHRTVVGNVHLSANRDGDWTAGNRHHAFQRSQLRMFHRALRDARRPDTELVIASGDFNVPSDSPLYPAVLEEGAWTDPFAEADRPTFHARLLPDGRPARRIDHLLVSRGPEDRVVTGASLLFPDRVRLADGRDTFLSDHLALSAEVTLPAPIA
ncbi:endonuclease/exonuclease/phosphatase family protein [Kitasatospora sp. NPDC048540]|uniref:endonuclease/exonuclease/phosphatase family protein n=1 Tax=Kitasatospora sp. NPDC048540 TaxID=3155634 RepID=UPI00053A69F8